MKPNQMTWPAFWKQWKPEKRRKLEGDQKFIEAINADDIYQAHDIAISLLTPNLTMPKQLRLQRKTSKLRKRLNEMLNKEMKPN